MKYFGDGLSEKHQELQKIIRKPDMLADAKKLFLEIHTELHSSAVSGGMRNAIDELLGDLSPRECGIMPSREDETIAWSIWHIARIEDLTMNLLVSGGEQIFDKRWKNKMNAPIADTGNALSDDEIMHLSKSVEFAELLAYRDAVGRRTRAIVGNMAAGEMRRKVPPRGLERIREAGGVTEQENSAWLLDFWGKKDIAGILLMPPTRHVMLHLNDCCKWKREIRAKAKFFRTE